MRRAVESARMRLPNARSLLSRYRDGTYLWNARNACLDIFRQFIWVSLPALVKFVSLEGGTVYLAF